jgi:aquaporin Z
MDVPTEGNMGANSYSGTAVLSELAAGQQIVVALITEILLTFIFVLTILGVTRKADNKAAAGLIIGLTLTVIHLASISVTGTSVNPARSIGPALFGGLDALKEVWLFIVAPLIGGMLAALTAYCLFDGEEGENNVKDAVIDSKSKSASTKT